jgi:broad specificity phosphatase PhoE
MNTGLCTVYLVRHGEVLNPEHVVYANLPGFPLSPTGRRQAEYSAERLPDHATIVASPLDRAVETATIIAERRSGRILVDDSLTEWGLSTRWAGHRWDTLDEVFPGELTAYLEHPHDLPFTPESLADVAKRMEGAVRGHLAITNGPLVIVSHQDPIQAARLALTGRPLTDLNRDKPQHAGVIELETRPAVPWAESTMWAPEQHTVTVKRHSDDGAHAAS